MLLSSKHGLGLQLIGLSSVLLLQALLGATAGISQAPKRGNVVGESAIHGRLITQRGLPVGRGRISLRSAEGVARWDAMTDARGQFRFDDIPAGAYFLSMSHPRYVESRAESHGPSRARQILNVAERETLEIDLTAIRGGAITGTIFDRFGEPMPDVPVRAYRYVIRAGRRTLVAAEAKSYPSNDLGQYRVANLPSGSYVIATDYRGDADDVTLPEGERSGFPETWYPGYRYHERAQSLRVKAGQDLAGIDFVLDPTSFVQVSGAVVTSKGQPADGAQILVRPSNEGHAVPTITAGTRTSHAGTFVLSNLQPGDYVITARTITPGGDHASPQQQTSPEYGQIRISVGSHSLNGATIHLRPGTRITGQIRADQALPTRLSALLVSDDLASGTYRRAVSPEGEFSMEVGPGQYRLAMVGLPDGWILERVWLDGRDVSEVPFVVSPSLPQGLSIQLSSRGAKLVGSVVRSISDPCVRCSAVVVPENIEQRAPAMNASRLAQTDEDGRFVLSGLKPGKYLALAAPHLDDDLLYDETFWRFVEQNGLRLTLVAGEHRQLLFPLVDFYR